MPDENLPNNEDPSKVVVTDPPADPPAGTDPDPAPETPAPKPATAEQAAETNRILQEMAESLRAKPGSAAPSTEQMRALIKEKTGLSDEGIDWVMTLNRQTVTAAVAPLGEKLSWNEIVQAKAGSKHPISGDIEKEMKEELKQYPKEMLSDGVLLEKVYLMAIGKAALKAPAKPATPAAPNDPVIRRTIVNNNPAPGGAGGGGSGAPAPANQLSQEEKDVARKMGCSEADYQKWKKTTIITPVAAA